MLSLNSTSGIGVSNLGHSHPKVTQAAQKQCGEIVSRENDQTQRPDQTLSATACLTDSFVPVSPNTTPGQVHAQVNIGFSKPYLVSMPHSGRKELSETND